MDDGMSVVLYCTGRVTHPPVEIYIYNGPVPVPEDTRFYNEHSIMELYCDRRRGGCGRSPRPGHDWLRELINGVIVNNTPGHMFDISYLDL
jgi:hypothetical protein